MPSPVAVILDMDGVMFDTERVAERIWKQTARELGYELNDEIFQRMVGRNAAGNLALLKSLRGSLGAAFPYRELLDTAQSRYRACLDTDGVPHKPGLIAFLQFLEARRIPKAVATSTASALATHKLRQGGVLQYFDVVVGGDQVTYGKPAPEIFLTAASRLGEPPANCVVLEDSGPGIEGAAAAGMVPILIPDRWQPAAPARAAARFIVESLDEARKVLEERLL